MLHFLLYVFKNIQNKSESFSNMGVLSLWRFSFSISIIVLKINSMELLIVSQVLLFHPGFSFLLPYLISVRAGGDHIFQRYNQAPAVLIHKILSEVFTKYKSIRGS